MCINNYLSCQWWNGIIKPPSEIKYFFESQKNSERVHILPQAPLLHLTPPFLSNIFAWTISNIISFCSLTQGACVSGASMLMIALNRLIEVRGTHNAHNLHTQIFPPTLETLHCASKPASYKTHKGLDWLTSTLWGVPSKSLSKRLQGCW